MTLLSIDGLVVDYDGFKALDGFSMTLGERALRVVIGPNGAGKSTLCDAIIGRVRAAAGHVVFAGEDITELAEHRIVARGICRKFQAPGLIASLTVAENMAVAARRDRRWWRALRFAAPPEERDTVDATLAEVGLIDRRDTVAGGLSHGEKQWLEIGMVMATGARLLLLDEPTAGMGPAETRATTAIIHRLVETRSVIVIDHDMSFVEALAAPVTVMHQGKLLTEGSVAEVRADARVAEVYLGRIAE